VESAAPSAQVFASYVSLVTCNQQNGQKSRRVAKVEEGSLPLFIKQRAWKALLLVLTSNSALALSDEFDDLLHRFTWRQFFPNRFDCLGGVVLRPINDPERLFN